MDLFYRAIGREKQLFASLSDLSLAFLSFLFFIFIFIYLFIYLLFIFFIFIFIFIFFGGRDLLRSLT